MSELRSGLLRCRLIEAGMLRPDGRALTHVQLPHGTVVLRMRAGERERAEAEATLEWGGFFIPEEPPSCTRA